VTCTDLDVDGKRHDEQRDYDVGDGERDDEVVGHGVETPLENDADADEHVAEQCHGRKQQQQQRPVAQPGGRYTDDE